MYIAISYDIPEDKRRTKIHKILKSYGQWMQYSVFECNLTETQYAKLRSRLNKLNERHRRKRTVYHFAPLARFAARSRSTAPFGRCIFRTQQAAGN